MTTPGTWVPHHRSEDDELVGHLCTDDRGTTPFTLAGFPLAGPLDHAAAVDLLEARGLAVLAEAWWLDDAAGEGFRVQILSADRDTVTVARGDFGFVSPDAERLRLRVPDDTRGLHPTTGAEAPVELSRRR